MICRVIPTFTHKKEEETEEKGIENKDLLATTKGVW